MKKILLYSLLVLMFTAEAVTLQPRAEKKNMTTSVIVPCVARHFFWLSGMLEAYENGTVRPDEIVISLSEVEKLDSTHIDKLANGLWSFKLVFIRNNGLVIDGDNRTIAMDNSSGDILIFSDADDLPHPQRVEVAKYFIENFEVDHILHGFALDRNDVKPINIHDVEPLRFANFGQVMNFGFNVFPITTGSPCFVRKIGERLKWQAIQDMQYNETVYSLFPNHIVLPLNLILYRRNLSSHAYKDHIKGEAA